MAGSCECGNEPQGSIKCGEFLDQLRTSERTLLHAVSYFVTVHSGFMIDPAYSQLSFTSATCPDHLILLNVISVVFGRQHTYQVHDTRFSPSPNYSSPLVTPVFLHNTSTVFKGSLHSSLTARSYINTKLVKLKFCFQTDQREISNYELNKVIVYLISSKNEP